MLLQNKLHIWDEVNVIWFQSQADYTEHQIKEQFKKLRQFLRDEEAATIIALREEENQKKQKMKEINSHISALSHTIKDLEETMKANDVCFLKVWPQIMDWLIDWLIKLLMINCVFVLQKFPVTMERWVICWCLCFLCFWSQSHCSSDSWMFFQSPDITAGSTDAFWRFDSCATLLG